MGAVKSRGRPAKSASKPWAMKRAVMRALASLDVHPSSPWASTKYAVVPKTPLLQAKLGTSNSEEPEQHQHEKAKRISKYPKQVFL